MYSEIEMNNANAINDKNNNYSYPNDDSSSPFYCDNSEGGQTEDTDEENQSGPSVSSKKPVLMRTASLGSWERPVKSGRFSVSPVDLNCEDSNLSGADIQINVDMITGSEDCIAVTVSGVDLVETRSYSSDEDNNSDLSQNETDCLCELVSLLFVKRLYELFFYLSSQANKTFLGQWAALVWRHQRDHSAV